MNYIVDHIPHATPCNRRPGMSMTPTTITIHNTANPSSTARNERGWLTNAGNDRTASYHIVVDEREAVECIPLNEIAWHAGDGNGQGNRASIGIEICESGDYDATLGNVVQLVARMLEERGWGVDRLRRHFDWSGKICPRLMYGNGSWEGWEAFKQRVAAEIGGEPKMSVEDADKIISILQSHYGVVAKLEGAKVANTLKEFGRLADELRIASGRRSVNVSFD